MIENDVTTFISIIIRQLSVYEPVLVLSLSLCSSFHFLECVSLPFSSEMDVSLHPSIHTK